MTVHVRTQLHSQLHAQKQKHQSFRKILTALQACVTVHSCLAIVAHEDVQFRVQLGIKIYLPYMMAQASIHIAAVARGAILMSVLFRCLRIVFATKGGFYLGDYWPLSRRSFNR